MSSSSSESDSDEFDQVRKIRINIRPKSEALEKAANIDELKASIESWRPLVPPLAPGLARRLSSMSSVSSLNCANKDDPRVYNIFGNGPNHLARSYQSQSSGQGTIHSSPSCSSLVNDFNNRSSFSSNFISRTSSPLTFSTNSDVVPIAIAIQESLDVIILKSQYESDKDYRERYFKSRAFGNMKLAFPSAYVKGLQGKPNARLSIELQATNYITKFFASSFVEDDESSSSNYRAIADDNKLIDFDMERLKKHLKNMHDQSPNQRYYNVDVLRYQVDGVRTLEQCPLLIRSYWKLEPEMMKLRIDFNYSSMCCALLEKFRDISFIVDLKDVIPVDLVANNTSPQSVHYQSHKLHAKDDEINPNSRQQQQERHSNININMNDNTMNLAHGNDDNNFNANNGFYSNCDQASNNNCKENDLLEFDRQTNMSGSTTTSSSGLTDLGNQMESGCESGSDRTNNYLFDSGGDAPITNPPPILTYQPQAKWDNSIKQLVWKFDNFWPLCTTDTKSQTQTLMAKIDFRHCPQVAKQLDIEHCEPGPVSAKFSILDTSMSKVELTVEPLGFKLAMVKKEMRAGKYQCEPLILH